MAGQQHDPAALFGIDDSNTAFYDETNPNSQDMPVTTEANQQFYAADPIWDLDDTPQFTSYDTNTLYPQAWNIEPPMHQQQPQSHHQHHQLPPTSLPEQTFKPDVAAISPVSSNGEPLPLAMPVNAPASTMQFGKPPQAVSQLTDAQRKQLQNIAMPSSLRYQSPKSESSPDSSGSHKGGASISSPEGTGGSTKSNSRKRKSSAELDDDDDDDDDGAHPVKKTAHNMIEKRYRTNLNDKIAALRDSVPSLRIMSKSARGEDTSNDREELHGLTPAHKLNKATVLSKATEYIRHLEKRNNRLMDENQAMQARIAAFEKLFMAGAMNGGLSPIQQAPTPIQFPQDAGYVNSPMATPRNNEPAQGMIQVPDDIKQIINAQMQSNQPYAVPQQTFRANQAMIRQQQIQQQQQQQMAQRGWQNAGPYFGRLMVGSLAGLMILEAVREDEQSNETPEGRGLFALPLSMLRQGASSLQFNAMGYHVGANQLISALRLLVILGGLLWLVVPSFFDRKSPKARITKKNSAALESAPPLAAPIQVRRQAWLTAIQTVWVPGHNFFLEAAALVLKTVKLSIRNMIGVHGYQMLTGLTEDQEVARVKAWSIALDAQLAGGDSEINKSRLTLTLLASQTLPDTPLRLMMKALHIRILLWELGGSSGHLSLVNTFACKLARAKWNEAKQLHMLLNQLRRGGKEQSDDELPDHLARILEQDCDDVLNATVVQRAHNLAWNNPTRHNSIGSTDGMDSVVDDEAVRSPMDAVAAWWSSLTLQRAMTDSLILKHDEDVESTQAIEAGVTLAIKTAPIGSGAQIRALVARAVLFNEKRGTNIAAALQALGPVTTSMSSTEGTPESTPPSSPALSPVPDPSSSMTDSDDSEVKASLRCAMAIAHLQKYKPPQSPAVMYQLIDDIAASIFNPTNFSLLGYTAAFKLMERLAAHDIAAEVCSSALERLAGGLRIWAGNKSEDGTLDFEQDVREEIVNKCLRITKTVVGLELDTGYGSMSEDEGERETQRETGMEEAVRV